VAGEPVTQTGPTLKQGCLLSFGALLLSFGGCLVAGVMDSDPLGAFSVMVGLAAIVVGFVLWIVRMVREDRRK
jgi:uncharacterized membrane protein